MGAPESSHFGRIDQWDFMAISSAMPGAVVMHRDLK
jgi:hypothetical protein